MPHNAHVVRELDRIAEVASQEAWASGMKKLLCDTIAACHQAAEQGRRRLPRRHLDSFLARYDAFVEAGLQANPDPPPGLKRSYLQAKSYNMAAALRDLRAEATLFASDLMVPPTNNEAERSLRMVKLHKKVSGCFQSEEHARHFAAIRSYIGTARKNGIGALDALGRLFRNDAWMPPATT